MDYMKKTFRTIISVLMALSFTVIPYMVEYENNTVNKSCITAQAYSTGEYVVKTSSGNGVNVRSEPNTASNNKVGAACDGIHFTIDSVNGEWGHTNAIKCTNGTKSGWVNLKYAQHVNGVVSAFNNVINAVTSAFSSGQYVVSVNTTLNVREQPNTSCRVIASLQNGTVLNIISQTNGWGYAENYGGYVSMKYCRFASDNSGGTSSGSSYTANAISDRKIYLIVPACAPNSCIDVKDRSTSNGTGIQIWESTGGDNQKFTAIDCGNGYFLFQDVNSGKAIDVPNGIPLPLLGVQLYDVNRTDAQLWRIIDAGGGYYRIQSKANENYYLDVRSGKSNNGTVLEVYFGNESDAQKFKFVETSASSGGGNSVGGGSSYLVDTSSKPASVVHTYSRSRDGEKRLSEHFKVKEFACKDGSDTVLIDQQLVYYCEMIRIHFGKPITVNSGYRTPAYNKRVGGAGGSYHMKGMAADIVVSGVSPQRVAQYAEEIGVQALHAYNTFTHIDTRPYRARWNG